RAFLDTRDQRASAPGQSESLGQIGREILDHDAQAPAPNLPVLDELLHDGARHVDRNREPNSDIASDGGQDGGVNADELSIQSQQCTARISGINGRISLNEIFVAFDINAASTKRADNARCHCLPEAEWVADGNDEISDLQLVGISERHCGQIVRFDSQQCDVGRRIATDQLGIQLPAILQRNDDLFSVPDNVMVSEHITILGIDNDARSGAQLWPTTRQLWEIEKAPEKWILEKRVGFYWTLGNHRYVDHRWSHPFKQ